MWMILMAHHECYCLSQISKLTQIEGSFFFFLNCRAVSSDDLFHSRKVDFLLSEKQRCYTNKFNNGTVLTGVPARYDRVMVRVSSHEQHHDPETKQWNSTFNQFIVFSDCPIQTSQCLQLKTGISTDTECASHSNPMR